MRAELSGSPAGKVHAAHDNSGDPKRSETCGRLRQEHAGQVDELGGGKHIIKEA